ncbi:ABC transporter substrate-binding protein [Microbacterium sp. NPDC057650]|uniref:ABC transporter substrate-binding protein n=1 Tax=unclassified Microbacterium TaxID=2609290 RepID=UPI00366C198B
MSNALTSRPARTIQLALLAGATAALLTGCGTITPEAPAAAEQDAAITVTDDQNRTVTLDGPAKKAVVLNSYGNEFVRAIGAGDTVVGVDSVSLERLPFLPVDESDVIAQGLNELNYEAIADLDPDVVILPRNAPWEEAATQLKAFDIPVVVATAWDYEVFDDTIDLLGEVFGKEKGADKVKAFHSEITGVLDEHLSGVDTKPVYLETVDPYLTVLPGSGFHALIEAAKGENIFSDAAGGDAQEELTVEPAEVVVRNPALILHEYEPAATPVDPAKFAATRKEISSRPGWTGVDAVADDQVYVASGYATSALAKSIGALYLASWLHPEEFEDVNPDDYLERWITEFQDTDFAGVDAYISTPAGS